MVGKDSSARKHVRRFAAGCALIAAAAFAGVTRADAAQSGLNPAVASPAASSPPAAPAPDTATAVVPPAVSAPIAIVPLGGKTGQAPTVTGALEVTADQAIITASGAVTSANATTDVSLPNRGMLHVCAATTVKLAADTSVPKGETPGLLMALDHGAIEANLTTGRNADMVLTPDFRILISGPGTANLKLRLGNKGDTCVDNPGVNAPYVLVSSLFGDGMYRVQPGQRVLFEHGSVHEVVDQEKEPCGCPPEVQPGSNEFPLAQSEGLAPLAKPAPAPPAENGPKSQMSLPLVYNSAEHAPKPAPPAVASAPPLPPPAQPEPPAAKHRRGFFRSIGHFFRKLFGAE
jgi:hypothetical protein